MTLYFNNNCYQSNRFITYLHHIIYCGTFMVIQKTQHKVLFLKWIDKEISPPAIGR